MFKYGDTVYVWDAVKTYGQFGDFIIDRGEQYEYRYGVTDRGGAEGNTIKVGFFRNGSPVIEMTKAQIAEKLGAPVLIIDEEDD